MGATPKILAFAGSTRKDSYNKKLVRVAAAGAQAAGAEVTVIDLAELPMPLFCEDLEAEQGPPEHAATFKRLMLDHNGLLIASPEYNSSIAPVLKNAIDWASRPAEGEGSLAAFAGKTAAIMSASPGALGGLRGLVHLRAILGNIGVLVLPDQITLRQAYDAFNDGGTLKEAKRQTSAEALGAKLAEAMKKLGGV